MNRSVLIAHNTFGDPDDPFYPSRWAVTDQVNAVAESLDRLGIGNEIVAVENLRALTDILAKSRHEYVFNLCEEFVGESINQSCYVPALCRAFGKRFSGNDTPALVLTQNKIYSKAVLTGYGLNCPAGVVLPINDCSLLESIEPGRYIIKPSLCDASEGITHDSVFYWPQDRERVLTLANELFQRFFQPLIVEQFIAGREINCSVLEVNGKPKVLAVAEIDFSAFKEGMLNIVDYDAKWSPDTFVYINTPRKLPAELPDDIYANIADVARRAWLATGCSGYVRVDMRLSEDNIPYILEVNANPDITPEAGFASALHYAGIEYHSFVESMISL